jgi:hypothetical protein
MQLQLNGAELEVVADLLRRAMSNLREEIYKTETTDFQAQLKKREAVLAGVLKKVAAVQAEPASTH